MGTYSVFSDGEFDLFDLGVTVTAELGRSYGFKRGADGSLDWDLRNIGEAFSDSPIWTTIDWLLLAVPPVRWAITAANISRGIGLAGRMYKLARSGSAAAAQDLARVSENVRTVAAAEKLLRSRKFRKLAARTPDRQHADPELAIAFGRALRTKLQKRSLGERVAERLGGEPLAQAMVIQRESGLPGQRGRLGRIISRFTSPLAHNISPEIVTLMRRYGADPAELRAFYVMAEAEQNAAQLIANTERNNLLKQLHELAKSYGVDYGALQEKLRGASGRNFLRDEMRGTALAAEQAGAKLTPAEKKFVTVTDEIMRLAEGAPRESSSILEDARAMKFLAAFESFRNKVHVEAYLSGHISGETFLRYMSKEKGPAVYAYLEKAIKEGRGEKAVEMLVRRKGYRHFPVWYIPRQYDRYSRGSGVPAGAIGKWAEAIMSNHKRRAELLEEMGMAGADPTDNRAVYEAITKKIAVDVQPPTIYANPVAGARAKGTKRFKARRIGVPDGPYTVREEMRITRKLVPVKSVEHALTALTEAYVLVSHNRLLQRLSDTAVVVDASDVLRHAKQLADSAPEALTRLYDADAELIEILRGLPRQVLSAPDDSLSRVVAQRLGWVPAERLFQGIRGMDAVPKATKAMYANRFIDPLVYRDIHGLMEALSVKIQGSFYSRVLSFFRASKTAYSPPTWFRAYVGNVVFHHFTTGGSPTFVPLKGLKSWLAQDEVYQQALQTGHILDSAISQEIRDILGDVAKRYSAKVEAPDVTALEWIGEGKVRNIIKRGGAKMEELYRAIDEVWKLDAFAEVHGLAKKVGLSEKDSIALATRQVVKFFPIFSQPSEVTNLLRQVIPFASFITESARAWKNALIERPHLAFFWNHVTETLSYMMAAVAGFSPEELDATKEAMPYFMRGKKALVLPFRIDDRPAVVDLSYIIPLADIAEAQAHEATFFQRLRIDPTTNPFISLIVAGATGVDPFSSRPIEPRFTERQLGINVPEGARRIVGLAEHVAVSLAPPLAPMGYGMTNILELVRKQKHPATGEPLEEGIGRTLAANLIGIRIYEADVRSQILNVRHEERILSEEMTHWWNTWEWAVANGAKGRAEKARQAIIRLRNELAGDGEEYFEKSIIRHVPGNLRSVPTRQLEKILERTRKIGARSAQDRRLLRRIKMELRRRSMNR